VDVDAERAKVVEAESPSAVRAAQGIRNIAMQRFDSVCTSYVMSSETHPVRYSRGEHPMIRLNAWLNALSES
jgi:hypothetical protein